MIGSVFVKQMLIFSQMGNCSVDGDAEQEQIAANEDPCQKQDHRSKGTVHQ